MTNTHTAITIYDIADEIPELTDGPVPQAGQKVKALAVFHPHTEVMVHIGRVADDGIAVRRLRWEDDTPYVAVWVNGTPVGTVDQPEGTDYLAWLGQWWADRIDDEFAGF